MDIRFSCFSCGQHLAAEPADAGQSFTCPYCKRIVVVPGRKPSAPTPLSPPRSSSPLPSTVKPVASKPDKGRVVTKPVRHSRLGLVSLLLSAGAGTILFFVSRWGVNAGAAGSDGLAGVFSNPVVLGLMLFVLAFVALLALGLGVFAAFQSDRKKLLGLLGTAVSIAALVMAVLRMLRGF